MSPINVSFLPLNSLNVTFTGAGVTATGGETNTYNELPIGLKNGINLVYSTASTYISSTTRVFLNGIRQTLGQDYSEVSNNQISFISAPLSGDSIIIDYRKT